MITQPSVRGPQSGALLRSGEVASLNGLRAVSVLLVLLGHSGDLGAIVPGGFGVTIFFFISGFIITTLLWREHERSGTIALGSFYVRRLLRLYPALLLLIAGVLALRLAQGKETDGLAVAGAVFYFVNYLDIFSWSRVPMEYGHLWSLAVEMHFYLLYPLLIAAFIAEPRKLALSLVALCVSVLLLRIAVCAVWPPSGNELVISYTSLATESRIDSIAYGALAAVLVLSAKSIQDLRALIDRRLVWLGFAALFAVLLWRNDTFRQSVRFSIQGLALMPVVTAAVLSTEWPRMRWVLNSGPFVTVGALSYSLYLWHPAIFLFSKDAFAAYGPVAALVIGWLITFAAAYLSYRLVELPFLGLRRRFGSEQKANPSPLRPSPAQGPKMTSEPKRPPGLGHQLTLPGE